MPRDRKTGSRPMRGRTRVARAGGESPRLTLITYDASGFTEKTGCGLEECLQSREGTGVAWINVDRLSDAVTLESLLEGFGIHPLVMEDVT